MIQPKGLGNSSGKHFCTNAYVKDTLNLEPQNTPKRSLNSSKNDLAKELGKFIRETFLYQRIHYGYSQFRITKYSKEVTKFIKKMIQPKKLGNSSGKHFCTKLYVMDTLNLEIGNTPKGLLNLSENDLVKDVGKFVRGTFLYQATRHIFPVLK